MSTRLRGVPWSQFPLQWNYRPARPSITVLPWVIVLRIRFTDKDLREGRKILDPITLH